MPSYLCPNASLFVSQRLWESMGGPGHRAAPQAMDQEATKRPLLTRPLSLLVPGGFHSHLFSGIFKQGNTERGGFCTRVRSRMFARGVWRDRTVTRVRLFPSCSWSITWTMIVCDICVTLRCRRAGGRAPSYRHPQARDCCSPWLTYAQYAIP